MKSRALKPLFAAATGTFLLLAGLTPAGAASLKSAAKKLSRAAAKTGVNRVAVSPFMPLDGSDPAEGRLISEKLATRIALHGKVRIVERERLEAVMAEHRLARTGILDPSKLAPLGKLLQAEAVIIGTFVTMGNTLEFSARLVLLETGEVLAARSVRMERSWYPAYGAIPVGSPISADDAVRDVYEMQKGRTYRSRVSFLARRQARPKAQDPEGWHAEADLRDSLGSGCSGADRRIDAIQASILDLKARYWASKLRDQGSLTGLDRVKPDRLISDPALKREFRERVYELAGCPQTPLSLEEVKRFIEADRRAFELYHTCSLTADAGRRTR